VNGVRIREFGGADGVGGQEKGLSISARPGAQITAPCDGWVVYAGPFRNYGQLLILNAGDGYHVLLAGMDRISVDLGQFVVTGEPVAVMGTFYVKKPHRRSAVPMILLELAIAQMQADGACALHAPITSESLSSRALENTFKKYGFAVIGTMMGRAL